MNKFFESYKFYMKILLKTPLFIISIFFNIFIFTVQLSALNQSTILQYTGVICYAIMSSNLYFLVSTASILYKRYEVMDFLEVDIFKKYLTVIISSLIISIFTSIIPIIFILVFRNQNITLFFLIKGIINVFIIVNLSNLLSIIIGASVGVLVKSWKSILLSLIIYSFFPLNLFNPIFKSSTIQKFFNIYSDSTTIITNIFCDEIFNISYICDKLLILLIIILGISIIRLIINKNGKTLSIISSVLIFIFIIITIFIGVNKVSIIHNYDKITDNNVVYNIINYKMDIHSESIFTNDVAINLDVNDTSKPIIFELDDLFKVKEVKVNNEVVEFTHANNQIILKYHSIEQENVDVAISYEGDIHVEDPLGVDANYCTKHAMNLTNTIKWYPYIYGNNSLINYSIKINSSVDVYSNLDTSSQHDGDNYLLEGRSQDISLFSGQYKEVNDNGIQYIIPNTTELENFKIDLDEYINSYINDPHYKLSENEIINLKEKKYRKVIVGIYIDNERYLKLSDDVLIIEL